MASRRRTRSLSNPKWSEHFRRVSPNLLAQPSFFVRGSTKWLYGYDGYLGGHDLIDRILELCRTHGFPSRSIGHDSPGNPSSFEEFYAFLDGGFEVFSGNYFFGSPGQGAYVRGFRALRWLLYQLDVQQPRKLKGETALHSLVELNELLSVPRLPYVSVQ